ncbi:hypothetical protein CCACVL1_06953 [Corchorus capsularis]|uniref:Uncharacterized protein n=1 Tax=Corchorus capsularis TaxID=210143 RepID=A0A1R3JAS0_COCAP|nr:hypothetical protein CCACVL1_06953 [Corchorus capsularis]
MAKNQNRQERKMRGNLTSASSSASHACNKIHLQ